MTPLEETALLRQEVKHLSDVVDRLIASQEKTVEVLELLLQIKKAK